MRFQPFLAQPDPTTPPLEIVLNLYRTKLSAVSLSLSLSLYRSPSFAVTLKLLRRNMVFIVSFFFFVYTYTYTYFIRLFDFNASLWLLSYAMETGYHGEFFFHFYDQAPPTISTVVKTSLQR